MQRHCAKLAVSIARGGAALLLLCLAIGCGRSDDSRTTIDFWAIGFEGERVESLIRDFERENPRLRVRLQQIPWTAAHEKLLTAFAGDATPDVCQLGNTWIPEFVALGALEPLDDRVKNSPVIQPNDYFPGIWETNRVDATLYGVPWYADTRVLFYRRDILKAAGYDKPPGTWDEWLTCMRRIKQMPPLTRTEIVASDEHGRSFRVRSSPDRFAILIPTNEWEQPTIFGLQMGAEMLRDDDQYGNFRSPQFRRAFEFYANIFAEDLAPIRTNTQISNVWDEFARGYFAMYITGPWNIGQFRRRLPPDVLEEWAVAPLPRPASSPYSISQAGGSGLVMFRQSKTKDAAWRLIEYLSRPESQVEFYRLTGNLPPCESAWKLGRLTDDPPVAAFHEQLQHAVPFPRVPEWEQITTKVMEADQVVIHGRKSVDQALEDLDQKVDQLLEKRRWMLARRRAGER